MIVSRLKWKRVEDGTEYKGFDMLTDPQLQLRPGDRVVLVWDQHIGAFGASYFVDCDAGIGEIRHMYRNEFAMTIQTLVLNQDLPSWIATSMWMKEPDMESETAVGPFYHEKDAMDRLRADEKRTGYMGGTILYLNKP